MSVRSIAIWILLVVGVSAQEACDFKTALASIVSKSPSSTEPDPHWVIQQSPPAKVALVYVHGVIGDMIGTWTSTSGARFWDLVNQNAQMRGKADAFVYGFPSYLFKPGSFDIQDAANQLHERLKNSHVFDYQEVVFVGHSMGGLVVLRELLTHRELLERVPVVMFYATPMEGSLIAAVGKQFSPNTALAEMTAANGNALLKIIDNEWKSIPDDERPHVRCAYETEGIVGVKVVPWASATRLCEGASPPISGNHTSIVKPDRPDADAIVDLSNALSDYFVFGVPSGYTGKVPPYRPTAGDKVVWALEDKVNNLRGSWETIPEYGQEMRGRVLEDAMKLSTDMANVDDKAVGPSGFVIKRAYGCYAYIIASATETNSDRKAAQAQRAIDSCKSASSELDFDFAHQNDSANLKYVADWAKREDQKPFADYLLAMALCLKASSTKNVPAMAASVSDLESSIPSYYLERYPPARDSTLKVCWKHKGS